MSTAARKALGPVAATPRHSRESGNPPPFARYAKYKDSGVEWLGEVPDGWSIVRLKQACAIAPSNVDKKSYGGQQLVRLCNYTDVYYNDEITEQIEFMSATATDEQVVKFSLKANDVLITKDSETPDNIAVPAYVPQDLNGVVCGYHLALLRPLANCSGKYLKYLLHSHYLRSTFAVAANGLTRYGLSQYALDNAEVPFPPNHEQKAIAAFLDREAAKIDALIAEQEKLVALLKEKRQALISHAVTKGLDPTVPMKDSGIGWLGRVPAHWEVRTISSLSTKITNGYVGPTRDILVEDGVRYLQSLHIKGNTIRFDTPYYVRCEWSDAHAKSILQAGDILIVQTGDIGQVAVVPPEFVGCNCHALIIVAPKHEIITGSYLAWLLNSSYGFDTLLSIQTGALHPHLNCGNVKDVLVPVPPIEEQHQIINHIEQKVGAADSLMAEAGMAIQLLKEHRSALISAAVTGKIDVRGLAQTAEAAQP